MCENSLFYVDFPKNLKISDREFENENGELSPVFLVAQKNQDPATSAFKTLGKQDQEFEVSQGYTARPFLIKQTKTPRG